MENGEAQAGTRFNSITPLILKLRDLIFGVQRPDLYTRISVYFNLVIWIAFFCWHLIGYTVISLRSTILEEKKIDVEELIFSRGEALGFRPYEFLNLLMEYHLISSICWGGVFIAIAMMWRKKKMFLVIMGASLGAYFFQLVFLMGWPYFMQDTTFTDKVMMIAIAANSLVCWIFMPRVRPQLPDDEE